MRKDFAPSCSATSSCVIWATLSSGPIPKMRIKHLLINAKHLKRWHMVAYIKHRLPLTKANFISCKPRNHLITWGYLHGTKEEAKLREAREILLRVTDVTTQGGLTKPDPRENRAVSSRQGMISFAPQRIRLILKRCLLAPYRKAKVHYQPKPGTSAPAPWEGRGGWRKEPSALGHARLAFGNNRPGAGLARQRVPRGALWAGRPVQHRLPS